MRKKRRNQNSPTPNERRTPIVGDYLDDVWRDRAGPKAASLPISDAVAFSLLKHEDGTAGSSTTQALASAELAYRADWVESGPKAKRERSKRLMEGSGQWIEWAQEEWKRQRAARREDPEHEFSTVRDMAIRVIEELKAAGKAGGDLPSISMVETAIATHKPTLDGARRKQPKKPGK